MLTNLKQCVVPSGTELIPIVDTPSAFLATTLNPLLAEKRHQLFFCIVADATTKSVLDSHVYSAEHQQHQQNQHNDQKQLDQNGQQYLKHNFVAEEVRKYCDYDATRQRYIVKDHVCDEITQELAIDFPELTSAEQVLRSQAHNKASAYEYAQLEQLLKEYVTPFTNTVKNPQEQASSNVSSSNKKDRTMQILSSSTKLKKSRSVPLFLRHFILESGTKQSTTNSDAIETSSSS